MDWETSSVSRTIRSGKCGNADVSQSAPRKARPRNNLLSREQRPRPTEQRISCPTARRANLPHSKRKSPRLKKICAPNVLRSKIRKSSLTLRACMPRMCKQKTRNVLWTIYTPAGPFSKRSKHDISLATDHSAIYSGDSHRVHCLDRDPRRNLPRAARLVREKKHREQGILRAQNVLHHDLRILLQPLRYSCFLSSDSIQIAIFRLVRLLDRGIFA